MSVVRCKKGHYYDAEKFSQCPHCGIYSDDEDDKTIAFHSSLDSEENDKTISIITDKNGAKYIAGWLVCIKGPEKGRDYRLYHGFNRIGRNHNLDVAVMEDSAISRESSLAVVYDDRQNQFHAVQQSGGTAYLNGQLLEGTKVIKTGDLIEIGKSEFEFIAFCREGRVWERD